MSALQAINACCSLDRSVSQRIKWRFRVRDAIDIHPVNVATEILVEAVVRIGSAPSIFFLDGGAHNNFAR